MSKQCAKCGDTKPVSEFSPDTRTSSGYQSWCRECSVATARQRRRERGESVLVDSGHYFTPRGRRLL